MSAACDARGAPRDSTRASTRASTRTRQASETYSTLTTVGFCAASLGTTSSSADLGTSTYTFFSSAAYASFPAVMLESTMAAPSYTNVPPSEFVTVHGSRTRSAHRIKSLPSMHAPSVSEQAGLCAGVLLPWIKYTGGAYGAGNVRTGRAPMRLRWSHEGR